MPKYQVKTQFVVEGHFDVTAINAATALHLVKEKCWTEGRPDIVSTAVNIDAKFPPQQEKKILGISRLRDVRND